MNENAILVSVLAAVLVVSITGLYMMNGSNTITGGAETQFLFELNDNQWIEVTPAAINLQITPGNGNNLLRFGTGPGSPYCTPDTGICSALAVGENTLTITYGGNIDALITAYADNSAPYGFGSSLEITTPAGEVSPDQADPNCNKAPSFVTLGDILNPTKLLDQLTPGSSSGAYLQVSGVPATTPPGVQALTLTVLVSVASPLC
jgi:hypothetical protein